MRHLISALLLLTIALPAQWSISADGAARGGTATFAIDWTQIPATTLTLHVVIVWQHDDGSSMAVEHWVTRPLVGHGRLTVAVPKAASGYAVDDGRSPTLLGTTR